MLDSSSQKTSESPESASEVRTMREPGQGFLDEAQRVVVVVDFGTMALPSNADLMARVRSGEVPFGVITPECDLAETFPRAGEDSIYCVFAAATDRVEVMVAQVEDAHLDAERAIIEASLGMMDNLVYR